MALRKNVRKTRKSPKYGRKRFYKRRYPIARRLSTNVHKFTRYEAQADGAYRTISCNFPVSGYNGTAFTFDLTRLTNYTEFYNLYDQYKITGVKVYFDWSPDNNSTSGLEIYTPKLWMFRDYDDATTPTLDEMTESTRVKCMRMSVHKTHSIFLRPAVLNQVYESVVSSGNVPKWGQWIDTADSAVPHYGLKLVAQGLPSNNLGKISCRVKYYLMFRGVQ